MGGQLFERPVILRSRQVRIIWARTTPPEGCGGPDARATTGGTTAAGSSGNKLTSHGFGRSHSAPSATSRLVRTSRLTAVDALPVVPQRLLPEPGAVTAIQALEGLALADLATDHRPYLVLTMVATVDGAAAVAHRPAPLSNPADRQLFQELRAHVDAVMVGAGTVRTERYGRLVRDPARRQRRAACGLTPDPLAIVVSRRLTLTPDLPLLADSHSRVLVLTTSAAELVGCVAEVSYLRPAPGGEVDLSAMLARLRAEYGVRSVLCEGGPTLNTSLPAW